jgi:hypothetical protein
MMEIGPSPVPLPKCWMLAPFWESIPPGLWKPGGRKGKRVLTASRESATVHEMARALHELGNPALPLDSVDSRKEQLFQALRANS